MTASQRTGYTKRRKQIWEALHLVEKLEVAHVAPPQVSTHGGARPQTQGFAASTAEASGMTKRRKQIWEALHPRETGGQTSPTCLSDGRASGPQHEQGFAASTAAITGEAKRTINQHLARADALGDDVERITGTSLDSMNPSPPMRVFSRLVLVL